MLLKDFKTAEELWLWTQTQEPLREDTTCVHEDCNHTTTKLSGLCKYHTVKGVDSNESAPLVKTTDGFLLVWNEEGYLPIGKAIAKLKYPHLNGTDVYYIDHDKQNCNPDNLQKAPSELIRFWGNWKYRGRRIPDQAINEWLVWKQKWATHAAEQLPIVVPTVEKPVEPTEEAKPISPLLRKVDWPW